MQCGEAADVDDQVSRSRDSFNSVARAELGDDSLLKVGDLTGRRERSTADRVAATDDVSWCSMAGTGWDGRDG